MAEEALACSWNGHLSVNHFTRRDPHGGDEAIVSFFLSFISFFSSVVQLLLEASLNSLLSCPTADSCR